MAISEEGLSTFWKFLSNSYNPYYLFDDDPDGLCSFLLCHKQTQGNWSVVKDSPKVSKNYALKALKDIMEEYMMKIYLKNI